MNREDIYSSAAFAVCVKRFHTWNMIREQTVGQHTCRMLQIYCEIFGVPRGEVLYYGLHHDSGELFAGDNPASAKWEVPTLKQGSDDAEKVGMSKLGIEMPTLTKLEFSRIKIVDALELWEFASGDLHMGNKFARPIVVACRKVALERSENSPDSSGRENLAVEQWIRKEETRYGRG